MIIFDISSIAYGLVHSFAKTDDITIELLRHGILKRISDITMDLKISKSCEIVIACDSKTNWRKECFEHYKANRKANRDKAADKINWSQFFDDFSQLMDELKDIKNFTVIKVDYAEADDIIATLCKLKQNATIISTDKDFRQLCVKYDKVRLYSPITNKYIDGIEYDLYEHIVKGDKDDGIPHVLNPSNAYTTDEKRTTLSKKKRLILMDFRHNMDNCIIDGADMEKVKERLAENKKLIDLDMIPEYVQNDILEQYNNYKKSMKSIFNYMIKHRLVKLMDSNAFK